MPYADRADFDAFGLPSATLNALASSSVQDSLLSAASGRMDSYFRGRYGLPLTAWGDELRECCCVLAAYRLVGRRGFNPDNAWERDLQERYKDWIAWLEGVQGNTIHPDVTETGAEYLAPEVLSDDARGW